MESAFGPTSNYSASDESSFRSVSARTPYRPVSLKCGVLVLQLVVLIVTAVP
jgi:hypothetical protein